MRVLKLFALCAAIAGCGEAPETDSAPVVAMTESARIVDVSVSRASIDAPAIIEWTTEPPGAPVSLLSSTDPDAAAAEMERIASDLTTGRYEAALPGRRYFALSTGSGKLVRAAARVLPLAGGRNFRDVGGYTTADGQRVKWGAVFRSGTMVGLTESDYAYLDDLDAKVLVDFRSAEERAAEPTDWLPDAPEYWARNYSSASSSEGLRTLLTSGELSAAATRAVMKRSYHDTATEHAEAYAVMFDRLASGQVPLVFNCSAGKDRTGVAAALLLTALGVPRDQVVADYAMSDDIVDYGAAFLEQSDGADADEGPYAFLRQLPPDVVMPLLASEPEYIEAALDVLAEEHGSVLGFIQTELDVTDEELEAIRALLLES